MPESVKAKETAKKKVTRRLNPEETLVRGPESPVEGDEALAGKSLRGVSSSSEVLAHGYNVLQIDDMDMFDNERNYVRMCPDIYGVARDPQPELRAYNQLRPAPKNGPKEKVLDQDDEDYGHSAASSGDDQDD